MAYFTLSVRYIYADKSINLLMHAVGMHFPVLTKGIFE
jgi:hypothetical protein